MNITLVGGSGFIGTRLIELLKKQGGHVLSNIDKNQSCFYPEITTIADVRDKAALKTLLQGQDLVVLLAAEHRDDVTPTSLYYDVNVGGARNVTEAMDACGVKRIFFMSSVSIYGLDKDCPDENSPAEPFNNYGKSKWEAEKVLRQWYNKDPQNHNLNILRPSVVFGERNRGNVYNLLRQISSGRFLMVGKGKNIKSMTYVGNIVSFINFLINEKSTDYQLFNYVDKPELNTQELVTLVGKVLGKHIPTIHIPRWMGMLGGYCFDILAAILRKKLSISSVRVKKFCAVTQFNANAAYASGFQPVCNLADALELTLKAEFITSPPPILLIINKLALRRGDWTLAPLYIKARPFVGYGCRTKIRQPSFFVPHNRYFINL